MEEIVEVYLNSMSNANKGSFLKPLVFFALLLLATRLPFLILIHRDCFSVDLAGWQEVVAAFKRGQNPYVETRFLNWPPLWMLFLYFLNSASEIMRIPLDIAIRCFLVLMDIVVVFFLYTRFSMMTKKETAFKWVLFGYVLNPVTFFLTVQHANFDILVGFFLLLCFFNLKCFVQTKMISNWLYASGFLGLGIVTKTIPLVFVPMMIILFCRIYKNEKPFPFKELTLGLYLMFFPVVLSLSLMYVLAPAAISQKVLGYHSTIAYGFGFPWILYILGMEAWIGVCKIFFLGILGALVCHLSFLKSKLSIESFLLPLLCIISFGPGHGNQYILWFLPLLLLKMPELSIMQRFIGLIFLSVAAVTYSMEYLFLDYLGGSLIRYHRDQPTLNLIADYIKWSHHGPYRIPLFLSYLVLFVMLLQGVSKKRKTELSSEFQVGS